jgi:hypothetical protein
MALPYKPTRTFIGVEGAASLGTSGPEALKTDTNEIVAMFDPLSVHGNATPGGIAIGNLATGEATVTPTANKLVLFDALGNLPGSIANAANVTTNINGHAITDILEADGVTAKKATTMNGVRVRAYVNNVQTQLGPGPMNTAYKIQLNAKTLDPKNKFDVATYRCTPGAGTYLLSGKIKVTNAYAICVYKNGSEYNILYPATGGPDIVMSDLIQLSADTDYIELYVIVAPAQTMTLSAGANESFLSIVQIA